MARCYRIGTAHLVAWILFTVLQLEFGLLPFSFVPLSNKVFRRPRNRSIQPAVHIAHEPSGRICLLVRVLLAPTMYYRVNCDLSRITDWSCGSFGWLYSR